MFCIVYNEFCLIVSILFFLRGVTSFSSPTSTPSSAYETIVEKSSFLLDPITGEPSTSSARPFLSTSTSNNNGKKSLVVLLPQLGEFDSSEYCEFLIAAKQSLKDANIELKIIGIGDKIAGQKFGQFIGLPLSDDANNNNNNDDDDVLLRLDPDGTLHKALGLYNGPNLSIPDTISDDVLKFFLRQLPGGIPDDDDKLRSVATAWLNYNAMCAGIGSPGTLREILRGYFGDKQAPERFQDDDIVKVGDFLQIGPGVGPTKIGPFKYNQWFADERGYQRPAELATIRLKNMVEVLTQWDEYVTNIDTIPQRGGTYLFDSDGTELYSYKSRGVLTYSETMPRPLLFLAPYIGEDAARNPLQLKDTNNDGDSGSDSNTVTPRGRGILKPVGKLMNVLSVLFKLENKLQAKVLGATESDFIAARKQIDDTINSSKIVIYTYGLSPFSSEAIAVIDEMGGDLDLECDYVELGLEWFLLNKEQSAIRTTLLEMTGQSSLPHVFVNGKHIGGLFTGTPDGSYPGLASMKESNELQKMISMS